MMGSQSISGAVDTLVFLHKKDTAHEGTLRIQGRDIEPTHKRIVFDSDFLYWRIVGDAVAPEEKLPEKQEEVLAVLEEAGPEGMRLKDIAEKLNKSRQAITNLLNGLEKRDMVINTDRGGWTLPQNVNDVNDSLGGCLQRLQTDGGENVNECKYVYKSLQSVSYPETEPPNPGPEPAPESPQLPDMPPGLGGRYDYLYTELVNRGVPPAEADRQTLEQVNREYQAAESELELW
jgi:biotin operon repressor